MCSPLPSSHLPWALCFHSSQSQPHPLFSEWPKCCLENNHIVQLPIGSAFRASITPRIKSQLLAMTSKALGDLAPAHLPDLTPCASPIKHHSLSRWPLWGLLLRNQARACHRAFASAVPSDWTLCRTGSFQFIGLSSRVICSERLSVGTHADHLFHFLSRTHQWGMTLFVLSSVSPHKNADSVSEGKDVRIPSSLKS